MKRTVLYSTLLVTLVFFGGCNKQENDADGIRAAINQHLASLKTLNLSAMDMNVMSFTVQDSQAHAHVEFRPKTGAPQGAGMQVEYSLSRQDGKWTVQSSQPAGGAIQHPGPGQNPHTNSAAPATGDFPNFSDLVHGQSRNSLPPGHPPVNGDASAPAK
jgi:hypothetical protein